MREHLLQTPISESDVAELELGDMVFVTGKLLTIRDLSHRRIAEYLEERRTNELPFELKDRAAFHCGPIVRTLGDGQWEAISVGPTSSSRFSPFVTPLLKAMGPRLIVGKGFLTREAIEGLVAYSAAFLQAVGGCAALYGTKVKKVANQYWPEFGMVDAVWEFDVEGFGPLSVEVDCRGNSSHRRLKEITLKENLERIYAELGIDLDADFVWWPRSVAGTREAVRYATSAGEKGSNDC